MFEAFPCVSQQLVLDHFILRKKEVQVHRATVQHAMTGLTDEEQAQMLFLAGKLIGSLQERVREEQENAH
jgi:hypothetical protein